MPQSLANILVHLVFSTKDRMPLIDAGIERELYPYISAVLGTNESPMISIGGTSDHLHLLFNLSRKKSIADIVESVKADSSKWIKTKGAEYRGFYWQSGYGAFSFSPNDYKRVIGYISDQKNHHVKRSFQEEYRELLKRSGTEYDERYVWD